MKYRPDEYEMKMSLCPELPRLQSNLSESSMNISGNERSFFYYIPEKLPQNAPLVFILHGSYSSGDIMRSFTCAKWDQMADKEKFIAVYPNAYAGKWNDGRRVKSEEITRLQIMEEPFFQALVDFFYSHYKIDREKVCWFGHSNGGHAIFRIVHTLPAILHAAAISCSNIPEENNRSIEFSNPPALPIMLIHGTEDPITPYNGGCSEIPMVAEFLGAGWSSAETLKYWLSAAGIETAPEIELVPNAKHDCIVEKFQWKQLGCPEIQHVVIHGGGHTLPNINFNFPSIVGRTNRDISISEEVWKFFKRSFPVM